MKKLTCASSNAGRLRLLLTIALPLVLLTTGLFGRASAASEKSAPSVASTGARPLVETPEPLPVDDVLRFPADHPYFPGEIIDGNEDPALALAQPGGGQSSSRSGFNVYSRDIALDLDDVLDADPGVIRWFVEIDKFLDADLTDDDPNCGINTEWDADLQAAFEALAAADVMLDVQFWANNWGSLWLCGYKGAGIYFNGAGLGFYRDFARHIYDLVVRL